MSGLEYPSIDELKACGRLPSPTGVALAIIELTRKESTEVDELVRVIKTDPALTGRLLKYANSAAVGTRRPAVAIDDAVIRIGFRAVTQVALGFSLLSQYRRGPCRAFDYDDYWQRSLAVAVATQVLNRTRKNIAPAEGFTCGLLSEIGRLALATVHPQAYAEVLEAWDHGTPDELARLEQQRFALTHDGLSAALLKDWGLPGVCVEAVYCRQEPDNGLLGQGTRSYELARCLHFAGRTAGLCTMDEAMRARVFPGFIAEATRMAFRDEEILTLLDGVAKEWRELGEVFEVPAGDVAALEEIVAAARANGSVGTAEPAAEGERYGALRILAVDDEPSDLSFLSECLKTAGHEVMTAADGAEALRRTFEACPQVVITDWTMPAMDGLELCKALRRAEKTRRVFVIMLTACEDENKLIEAFEAGADDYVVKPYNARTLAARLLAARRAITMQEEVERDKNGVEAYAAQLGVANRRLGRVAFIDSLTLLPNRHSGMVRLAHEWRAADCGTPLACLALDLDGFKTINDRHGHAAGDCVLRETAAMLRGALRGSDMVARMGGDEFIVICPNADMDAALPIAERIRAGLEGHEVAYGAARCTVSVSIGAAVRTADMEGPEALLRAADEALYAAKRAGKNCVRTITDRVTA